MRKIILLSLFCFAGCAGLPCSDSRLLNQYSSGLDEAELELKRTAIDWQKLNAQARELSDLATELLFEYRRRHPQCNDFVDFIIAHQGEMLGQSLSQLERLYHEGEGLPQTDQQCLSSKDLIVRPQTLRVLIREQGDSGIDYLAEMRDEMGLLRISFKKFSRHYSTSSKR